MDCRSYLRRHHLEYLLRQNIIVAGSYAIRNVPESPYTVEELGKVTSTSSWGRLADGRLLPDVVTPGHLIFSTLNGAMTDLFSYDTKYAEDYPKVDAITDAAGKKQQTFSARAHGHAARAFFLVAAHKRRAVFADIHANDTFRGVNVHRKRGINAKQSTADFTGDFY